MFGVIYSFAAIHHKMPIYYLLGLALSVGRPGALMIKSESRSLGKKRIVLNVAVIYAHS